MNGSRRLHLAGETGHTPGKNQQCTWWVRWLLKALGEGARSGLAVSGEEVLLIGLSKQNREAF